jgi:hypothetical protein
MVSMPANTQPADPAKRHSRVLRLSVLAVVVVLVGVGLYALWDHATRSELGMTFLSFISPSLMPTNRLVQNIQGSDPDLRRESLAILTDRKDPAGLSAALPLLKSDDAYVWFNAALYLGSLNRQEAVPFLIKGLRHYASRAHQDCANDLSAITGQNFGTDFQKWRDWLEKTHPSSGFDFDSNLGRP